MNPASLTGLVVAASSVRAIGAVVAVLAVLGVVIYAAVSYFSGRDEVGSEIELAPNRKPYYGDEELETKKLNRTLGTAVVLLAVSAVGLPLYWLGEPSRQEGAIDDMDRIFVSRGLEQYEEGSQCVNCHAAEGAGGTAPFTILDNNGLFVAQVNWIAPALNTVLLRFSEEEVFNIIDLGRPGTPMPAWGARGGGPRSDQQIDNLVDYLDSIQLTSDVAQREGEIQLAIELNLLDPALSEDDAAVDAALAGIDWDDPATGAAASQLGKQPAFAGGAYACARCHNQGFSIITEGEDAVQPEDADLAPYTGFEPGSGGFGPPLDTLIPRKFASIDELAEFISTGSEDGVGYGKLSSMGSGNMPGFGDNPNTVDTPGDGMMSTRMICSIAVYESTLRGDGPPANTVPEPPPTTTTTVAEGEEGEEAEEEADTEQALPFCEQAFLDAEGEGDVTATDGEESEE